MRTTTEQQQDIDSKKTRPVVTTRCLVLGTLLIPLNCYWMAVMEVQWNSVDATCVSLFFHVIFLVFLLVVFNRLVKSRFPRWVLSPAEILVIYIMLSIASAVAGRDMMENLPSVLGHPFWFADQGNGYSKFFHLIPKWLAPQDPTALRGYYLGGSSIYDWQMLKVWLPIIGAWSGFIIAMLLVMLCINVIVRRHWMDGEKLQFPTIVLPLQMAKEESFFNNKILWLGFSIAFGLELLNGLHYLFPAIPGIDLKLRDVGQYATTPPWTGLSWTPVAFYPFAIGMAFFLPLDLSFSCWFFYVVRKLTGVAGVAMGYVTPGGYLGNTWPFCKEQGAGAWIGLILFIVLAGRKQLVQIFRTAIRGGPEDDGELMSYRTALLGIALGGAAMYFFCVKAGMSLWLPPVYLGMFFLISIGVTRIRAELGPPAHELNWINPESIVVSVVGSANLATGALTALTYMFWFNRGYRSDPMPHQLEGMKIGRDSRMEPKRLLAAMVIAGVVAVFAAFWALLLVFYQNGEATAKIQAFTTGVGTEAFTRLNDWTNNPRPTNTLQLSWMSVGFVFTLFLMAMKSRFFWWPFHPAGYALANSYALEYWWTTMLIGWAIKFLVVRYGGGRGYKKAIPFFAGLILGDYIAASFWSILGWAMGMSMYRTFIF